MSSDNKTFINYVNVGKTINLRGNKCRSKTHIISHKPPPFRRLGVGTEIDMNMDTAETMPQSVIERRDQETVDEYDLAALGHGQALSRKFDLWSILALAFCVLGTWSTFAQVGEYIHSP